MNDSVSLVAAVAAGILLGVMFFGGLWWTVRQGLSSQRAALWFLGSLLLRLSLVLLGFYFTLGDSWQRLLAGLVGFTVARLIVTRLTRVSDQSRSFA
jgi:F1F0 ATPase subunit 2